MRVIVLILVILGLLSQGHSQTIRQCTKMVFKDQLRPENTNFEPSECAPGLVSIDRKCVPINKAIENANGNACTVKSDCNLVGTFEKNHFESPPPYAQLMECVKERCQLPVLEGGKCTVDEECIPGVCREGICTRAFNGEKCNNDRISCLKHSRCTTHGVCVRKSKLHENCLQAEDCDENLFCSEMNVCAYRYQIGERCQDSQADRCVQGAFCRKHSCCGNEDGKSYCEKTRGPGAYCEDNSWCEGASEGFGMCISNRCIKLPMPIRGKDLDPCSNSFQCSDGFTCLEGVCRKQFSQTCSNGNQCSPDNQCYCDLNTIQGEPSINGTCGLPTLFACSQDYLDLTICIKKARAYNSFTWQTTYEEYYDPSCCLQFELLSQCVKRQVSNGFVKDAIPSEVMNALGAMPNCPVNFPLGTIIGAAVGALVTFSGLCCICLIGVIVVVILCCCLKKKKKPQHTEINTDETTSLTQASNKDTV